MKANLVKLKAEKHHIDIGYKLSDIDNSFDLAILVAYGKIIPAEILSKPKFGFVNVHPSLLPKYRGPSPIQTAILEGDKETGVTIIKLDQEVDHGPILAQKEIEIAGDDTHESLTEKTGQAGSKLLVEILPRYLSGKIKPQEQNHANATFTEKIIKADGFINLENPPSAKALDLMIRAYFPWPAIWTKTELNGKLKIIKFLPKGLIQIEGKNPMTKEEILNGYPTLKPQIAKLV